MRETTLAPTWDRRRDCRPQDSKSTERAAALSPNGMILPTTPGKREAGKLAWRLTRGGAKVEGRMGAKRGFGGGGLREVGSFVPRGFGNPGGASRVVNVVSHCVLEQSAISGDTKKPALSCFRY